MLNHLISLLWRIALLKKGPDELPHSHRLLVVLFVLDVVYALPPTMGSLPLGFAVAMRLFEVALITILVVALLRLCDRRERIVQSLTAIYGTNIVLMIFMWFLLVFALVIPAFRYVVLLIYVMWRIAIVAFILRQACDLQFRRSVLLASLMQALLLLFNFLFTPYAITSA